MLPVRSIAAPITIGPALDGAAVVAADAGVVGVVAATVLAAGATVVVTAAAVVAFVVAVLALELPHAAPIRPAATKIAASDFLGIEDSPLCLSGVNRRPISPGVHRHFVFLTIVTNQSDVAEVSTRIPMLSKVYRSVRNPSHCRLQCVTHRLP
jgi:hypothetical protein